MHLSLIHIFLIYTGPIYSTILAAIFLKEKLNIKGVLCIAAVVVGMLFIVGIVTPEGLTLDLDPKYTFGNAIAFASGVAYGLYLFFSRYREDCDSNVRSWWNFLFGSLSIVVLLVWHHFFLQPLSYTEKINGVTQFDASGQIITHAWNMFTMPGSSWVVLIAAALITGFGAFYLLTHATKRLKAGELAAISYQETIMASLLGLFMFGETMTTFPVSYTHLVNDNMRFIVEIFSKLECEVLNDWFRSDAPTDLVRWTDDLVSLVPDRLYRALRIDEPGGTSAG